MNNAGGRRLPPGYRFKPSDEEMMHHLFHKINTGVALMPAIKDINLYDYSPETLANMYPPVGDNEWYFFTPTQRRHPNGKKPDRSAGDGFWRAMTADTELMRGGEIIGRKLTLVYHNGSNRGKGVRSSWMMHEFRVDKRLHVRTHANDMTLVDWVMCKLYQNARKVEVNKRARKTQIAREAGGEGFNNGGADDSRALINQQQQQYHHPQFHHQTMLFDHNNSANQAASASEFNNGSASGCMMMVGKEYSRAQINPNSHHQTMLFDHNTANYEASTSAAAAAGGKEFNNGGEGDGEGECMIMAAEDMGTPFNPPNYYNPYLDRTSLFNNVYVNYQTAAAGGSQEFNNGSHRYSSYFDQCSSSSNANDVEAQGFYNGRGKAIINNNQQDYCPPSPLDQIVYGDVEAGARNEEFYINGRGHCMMQGERVEMGDDFLTQMMIMKTTTPSPSHHRPPSN